MSRMAASIKPSSVGISCCRGSTVALSGQRSAVSRKKNEEKARQGVIRNTEAEQKSAVSDQQDGEGEGPVDSNPHL
jgi:hypothetical protein